MAKAVFIDRDGTLNVEVEYLFRIENLHFIPGSIESIKRLNEAGYKVVVITNQSGVARGYYTTDDVDKLHEHIKLEFEKKKAHIDAFFYCPHLYDGPISAYARECECRKPKPGMVLDAQKALGINLEQSYIIGDSLSDMQLLRSLPLTGILVRTGHGAETEKQLPSERLSSVQVVNDLSEAVSFILAQGN